MIVFEEVSFRYRKTNPDVLRDVSLSIREGITTAVLGLSGSGKTTMLNLMGLLWDKGIQQGKIHYVDESGTEQHYHELWPQAKARLRLREFGFVMQSSYMLPHFTCAQNIAMPLCMQKVPADEQLRRVDEVLWRADPSGELSNLKDGPAREVSGGQGQRMGLLRAVIHDPRVLFADEPLSNLDPENAETMLELLQDWKEGKLHKSNDRRRSLVLVTHDRSLAIKWADEFVVISGGCIVGGRVWKKDEISDPHQLKEMMNRYKQEVPDDTNAAPQHGDNGSQNGSPQT